MNERIQQLAEQAGITSNNLSDGNMSHNDLEKFAELIVRECSNIVFEAGCTWDNPNCPDEELYQLSNRIEQHFGVEL